MGRLADVEDWCQKQLEHCLSRGVCPFYLRDRLSQLSASSSAATTLANSSAGASASSPSASASHSNLSSAASSPCGLTPHDTSRLLKLGVAGALKKSRSLAFAIVRPKKKKNNKEGAGDGESKEKEKRKKAGGFWSKLVMGSKRMREVEDNGDMLQSRKKKPLAGWTLF